MISEVVEQLGHSDKPIVKNIFHTDDTKVMAIGLARGVELAEHSTAVKTKLLVIKGEIDFNTENESRRYACYESYDIPIHVKHSVVAYNDAIFLLFMSKSS